MITLTGFTDEALTSFPGQVRMASQAGLTHIELRRIGTRPILEASTRTLAAAQDALADHSVRVSCIATGLGKQPVNAPLGPQLDGLRRAAAFAHDEDVTLLHENEKGIFGDTPERCLELVAASGNTLRLIFDPANFVQCGVRPFDHAWPQLVDDVSYLHAKDARAATGRVTPVGEGDGQWAELADWLRASDWDGFCSLEPHLGLGGRGGPVTTRRWVDALATLRSVLTA